MGGDLIDIVERAYCVQDDDTTWLAGVLAATSQHLDAGLGSLACLYDRNAPEVVSKFLEVDIDAHIVASLRGPITQLAAQSGGPLRFDDIFGVHAANPDGTGAYLGFPLPRMHRLGKNIDARWSLIAAHLAAGLRLQRTARRIALDNAEAVLSPDGSKLLSASAAVEPAREALRRHALRIDRARGALRRRSPDLALDAWQALIEGRWSLVDYFDSDGKRFLLAMPNAPTTLDPRALSDEERPVLHYIAMGHSNKLIAYELGIPIGTVASRSAVILRKLGVASRVEIIDRYLSLRSMSVARIDGLIVGRSAAAPPALPSLTTAEREVAELAARGLGTDRIAALRGSSERTVANLLARIYKKLGVHSRAELAHRLLR
jgi:DNA-binding NarL/FixJ family response regulator